MKNISEARIVTAGDSVVIVEFEELIDLAVNARAIALAARIQSAAIAGVRDVVPTYRSVAVYFDPLRTDYDALYGELESEAMRPATEAAAARKPVRIPVCYGGDYGPDLAAVAALAGLSEADVVGLHTGATYHVFMLGFVPGFAYMGIVDQRIAVARHSTPRVRVPAGTVAIAGIQTGIYPAETPGGWQLIGRTPLKPFDALRPEPFLVAAGDAVQFYAIDRNQYEREKSGPAQPAARGESLSSHRDGRGAPPARRDDREYRQYLSEEQRSRRGCIARRMQPEFHHGLLRPRGAAA